MLMTYFMIGIMFSIIEITLVENMPTLKRWIQRNPITEMVFSLALSLVVGFALMIPEGVTIAIGNVFSTVMTMAWYKVDPLPRWAAFKSKWEARKAKVNHACSRVSYRYNQVRHPVKAVHVVARAKRGRV